MNKSLNPQIITIKNSNLFQLQDQNMDVKRYLVKQKKFEEINIVFFGTPEFSAYILEELINSPQNPFRSSVLLQNVHRQNTTFLKFNIQAVVTNPDEKVGRKQILTPSPASLVAKKYNIPALKPEKLTQAFILNNYNLLSADLFVVVAFGKIIPKELLNIPGLGAINVHGSILPKYRGASPIQAAILNGDKVTGVTIMLMDERVDHGPILATKEVKIKNNDTFESLSKSLMQEAPPLLINTLIKFTQGKIKPVVQNHALATFCTIIKKEDGYFEIENPPSKDKLDKMIRAYYPWPNVWTRFKKKIVKFYPNQMVQIEGKNPVKLKDFLNGYPDFPIKAF